MTNSTETIYILQCQHGKYYVGRTTNSKKRIQEHFDGKGSFWTRLHPPEDVCDIISSCTKYDEDKYVIMYMDKYGVENVRGGSWSKCVLDSIQIEMANRMINSTNDKCGSCKGDHFIKDCDKKDLFKVQDIETTCFGCKEKFADLGQTINHKKTCTKFWDIEIIDPSYFEWAQYHSIHKQCDIWIINKIYHRCHVFGIKGNDKGAYDDRHQPIDKELRIRKRATSVYDNDILSIYIRSQFQLNIEELKLTLPK